MDYQFFVRLENRVQNVEYGRKNAEKLQRNISCGPFQSELLTKSGLTQF